MIFKKFKDLFISLLIIFIPIGLWILRNILVTGYFLGKRTSSATSLIENVALMGYNLISYFLDFKFIINSSGTDPNIELLNENIIIVLSIGGIIGILVFIFLFKNKNKILNILKEESSNIIWIVCYVGFIIITSTLIKYDEINTRFTALIFIQLMVVFIKLIDNFKSKLIMMILYCYFVIFIIINCIQLF